MVISNKCGIFAVLKIFINEKFNKLKDMGVIKWTYEKCYEVARKYETNKDFRDNEPSAYSAALRWDWVKEFTWFKQLCTPVNYWTYERTYEEAKKYKCKVDFQRGTRGAYKAALRNNWLNDYTWMKTPESHNKKWCYETCMEAAKQFTIYTDFANAYPKALDVARKNGWVDEYTWLERKSKPSGYWTYEHCYEEAKKYKSRVEFEKESGSAYGVAVKNGWLDDYTWIPKRKSPECKWTKEKCFEVAKQFKTKQDFRYSRHDAYMAAVRRDWMKEMDWFVPKAIEEMALFKKMHCVYVYKDDELNVAYIGLTINLHTRHLRHKKCGSVFKFFTEVGKEIPEPIVLKDNLTPEESRYYEDYYLKEFQEKGYQTLNKGCTGIYCGSFGGGRVIYTEEKAMEIAKKYKTIKDFRENEQSCYARSKLMGWLKDYTWLKRAHKVWTYEMFKEILDKYDDYCEFRKNEPGAYEAAIRNGWMDRLKRLDKKAINWTKEMVEELARNYTTNWDFRKNEPLAYSAAIRHKWINDFTWLEKRQKEFGYWSKERIMEIAKNYEYVTDFRKYEKEAYSQATKKGLMKELTWLKYKTMPSGTWTKEKVFEKSREFTTINEFAKKANGAYTAACRKGWISEITWLTRIKQPTNQKPKK